MPWDTSSPIRATYHVMKRKAIAGRPAPDELPTLLPDAVTTAPLSATETGTGRAEHPVVLITGSEI